MADVELSGVTKSWGGVPAVDRVSFSATRGKLVAVLGPSGCGKSTTLRLVAGLEAANEGSIRIAEKEVTRLPPARRGVSMVFQNYALFPHLSAAKNILFGLKVRKVARADRESRLKRAPGPRTPEPGSGGRRPAAIMSTGRRPSRPVPVGPPGC